MSHTPGPWKVVDRWYVWTDDDVGCEVAKVCDENLDDDTLVQADADARLIAAAPELLAALKLLRDPGGSGQWPCYCTDPHYYGGKCENCIATAAIDKAEGRSE